MKPICLGTGEWIINRDSLLFCLCPVCTNEINWRHVDMSYELTGECCCFAYRAIPLKDMKMYRISGKPADMTNVLWLPKRNKLRTPA